MEVAPLKKGFGCEITGLHLPSAVDESGALSEAQFRLLVEAFSQHGLVVLRDQYGLQPQHEVAIYRQLGSFWTDRDDINAEERDLGPGGFSEIGVIGQEEFDHQMSLGDQSHEYDKIEWSVTAPRRAACSALCTAQPEALPCAGTPMGRRTLAECRCCSGSRATRHPLSARAASCAGR